MTTTSDRFVDEDIPADNADEVSERLESILDAPDYSEFVRQPKSGKARQYERKVASMAKSGMQFSIATNRLDDAAAFIHYGPSMAAAAGDFAAANDRAAGMIDMICSPSNPTLTFILAAIPLVGQLMRNHEAELSQIPTTRKARKERKAERKMAAESAPAVQFRIPILGKTITMRMRMRARLLTGLVGGFKKGTQDPDTLTIKVFSDDKVVAALKKQGFNIVTTNGPDNG